MTLKQMAESTGKTIAFYEGRRRKAPNATDEQLLLPVDEWNEFLRTAENLNVKTFQCTDGIVKDFELVEITGRPIKYIRIAMNRAHGKTLTKAELIKAMYPKRQYKHIAGYYTGDYTVSEIKTWYRERGRYDPQWKVILLDMLREFSFEEIKPIINLLENLNDGT